MFPALMARWSATALIVLAAAPGLVRPRDGDQAVSAAVSRIQGWLDSWQTLAGDFAQVLVSPTLPSAQIEAGHFEVSRPDRMRWDYREPEKKTAVTDGITTWLYVPADRQVVRGRLDSLRRDGAVSLLLGGSLRLDEAFIILEIVEADDGVVLQLGPRQESQSISGVELRAAASGEIREFTVTDPTGNRVTWRFRDLALNPDLESGRFTFEVPQGVEIQDLDDPPGEPSSP